MHKLVSLPPKLSRILSLHLQFLRMKNPPQTKTKKEKKKTKTDEICTFCSKQRHIEARCSIKLNAFEEVMKKHNISIGKRHALSAQAICKCTDNWILDSGASHHMTSCQDLFPSTSPSNISQIVVGDSTQLEVLGSGTVQMTHGCINNVLLIPEISENLLSIYQICHSGNGKIVEFSPNEVVIRELHEPAVVLAIGQVDHASRLYKFVCFEPSSASSFIARADSLSKLWHERFRHLNYRYLQQMYTQNLVSDLPKVSCIDGVCTGCALANNTKIPFLKGKPQGQKHLLSWCIVI